MEIVSILRADKNEHCQGVVTIRNKKLMKRNLEICLEKFSKIRKLNTARKLRPK